MNAIALLAALHIVPGQNLCWMAALPQESPRTPVAAQVISVEQLPTTEPGAWIQTSRYPGMQFHVPLRDLGLCAGAPAAAQDIVATGESAAVTRRAATMP